MSLIKNTFEIECLIQALLNLTEATNIHHKERDKYIESGGSNWDCAGNYYVKKVEEEAEFFGDKLNELIDKRVNTILANK